MNLEIPVVILIAINAIVSFKGFSDRDFFEKYKFNVGSIRRGEQLRMVTSAFLHADPTHLIFNMITLFFFAPIVVQKLGATSFFIIYAVSLLAGNLLSYFFNKDNYYYSAIGASGAVSGVLYASILIYPDMMLYMFFAIPIPGYVFGIGYLLYSIYGMKNKSDNIGHDAHFGGAVGGYLATIALYPAVIQESTLMLVLLLIPIILLFVLRKAGKL